MDKMYRINAVKIKVMLAANTEQIDRWLEDPSSEPKESLFLRSNILHKSRYFSVFEIFALYFLFLGPLPQLYIRFAVVVG